LEETESLNAAVSNRHLDMMLMMMMMMITTTTTTTVVVLDVNAYERLLE
jgi:hypothetical protein